MTEQNLNNSGKVPDADNQDSQTKTDSGSSCCGPEMAAVKVECPCVSFCKKHPLVSLGFISVMLLMFLISQVGGILGIIAFIRTL